MVPPLIDSLLKPIRSIPTLLLPLQFPPTPLWGFTSCNIKVSKDAYLVTTLILLRKMRRRQEVELPKFTELVLKPQVEPSLLSYYSPLSIILTIIS
jgi:hypothetical protein